VKPPDLTGLIFGRLRVIGSALPNRQGSACSRVRCECGTEKTVKSFDLTRGFTRSCGCLRTASITVHGHGKRAQRTSTYRTWQGMIQRCTNPKANGFERYGGRGISVCQRWKNSFVNFLSDMGERPHDKTLDRHPDGNGNYEPGNCRWATIEQQNKDKRCKRPIEHDGKSMSAVKWAAIVGINPALIWWRLRTGWSVPDALGIPSHVLGTRSHKHFPRNRGKL